MSYYSSVVLADQPIRYYRLGESAGTIATDLGSGAQNGTITGGVTLSRTGLIYGDADTSMLFDGTSGGITFPTTGLPTGANPWTVEAWVKLPDSPAPSADFPAILEMGTATTNEKVVLYYFGNKFSVSGQAGTNEIDTTLIPFLGGAVYHVVATYDGVTQNLYINGVLRASLVCAYNLIVGGSNDIGGHSATTFWKGTIDEVAIYTTALDQAHIQTHYNAGLNSSTRWHRPRYIMRGITGSIFTPFQAIPAWVDRAFGGNFVRQTTPTNVPRYVLRGLMSTLINYGLNISTRFRLGLLKDISTRFILGTGGATQSIRDIATRLRLRSADQLKDIQTRFRLMQGSVRDVATRFRLRSADLLKDITTRFRLRSANQLKDVATRFRLAQQSIRDVATRFRLQSANQLKDVSTRFRLRSADQLKDIAARFRLSQSSVRDIATRLRLRSANQLKDIASRLRLGLIRDVATRFRLGSLRDIATRFRLMSASQLRDIAARLRLGLLKDVSTRFILSGNQVSKDVAARFRLRSANVLKDISTRFRLGILKDVSTRLRLAQQRVNDISSRFRLRSANQLKDITSRFRLMSAGQLRDVSTRLRLRSASILKDITSRLRLGTIRDVKCRFVLGTAAGSAVFQFQSVVLPRLNVHSTLASTLNAVSSRLQSLPLIGRVVSALSSTETLKSALSFTRIGVMMPAPFTTIQSTITVTDTTGTLVSNASLVTLTITYPDQTTAALTMAGGGITNLGSGQYQAKYNTKASGPTRELWSVTAVDGVTVATYQFEVGVGY